MLINMVWQAIWDTTAFNDRSEWPADGSQPFVLSTGDRYVSSIYIGK